MVSEESAQAAATIKARLVELQRHQEHVLREIDEIATAQVARIEGASGDAERAQSAWGEFTTWRDSMLTTAKKHLSAEVYALYGALAFCADMRTDGPFEARDQEIIVTRIPRSAA